MPPPQPAARAAQVFDDDAAEEQPQPTRQRRRRPRADQFREVTIPARSTDPIPHGISYHSQTQPHDMYPGTSSSYMPDISGMPSSSRGPTHTGFGQPGLPPNMSNLFQTPPDLGFDAFSRLSSRSTLYMGRHSVDLGSTSYSRSSTQLFTDVPSPFQDTIGGSSTHIQHQSQPEPPQPQPPQNWRDRLRNAAQRRRPDCGTGRRH